MASVIEGYDFGKIKIGGKTYTSDVILVSGQVRADWWRKEGHRLDVDDLEEVLKDPPEILVVGTGYSGCMDVPQETRKYLEMKGIKVTVMRTKDAVRIFNELASSKKVAGAFHLTC